MRSSERARDLGEVFTPEGTVNEMLDLLQDINYASKFLEPGCGSVNFLVEILNRKIDMVSRLPEVATSLKSGRLSEFEFKCMVALASASASELAGKLEPMFDRHCYDCHDADAKKGGLDLTALKWQPDDIENLQQWTKVFDKVERGEMPPKKKARPPAEVSSAFLKTLRGELHG
jgi:hypothetical protein